jgi:hypothetical protein
MKKTISTFLAGMAAVTALGLATAGQADAAPVINSFTKYSVNNTVTINGVNTNTVTLTNSMWSSGSGLYIWDPVPGGDNNYTFGSASTDDKYGFAGAFFTLSENANVTMKVTVFNSGLLSATGIYLYDSAFDRANPHTNRIGFGDGLTGITQSLLAGKTYYMIVTSDLPKVPAIGSGIVSSEITAAPVPIPAAALLLGSGLVGLAGLRKRQQ